MNAQEEGPPAGLVCPACRSARLPAVYTRRVGRDTVRVRRCKACAANGVQVRVRTVERVEPAAARG